MGSLRARVENGRLILNDPTALPEGTIMDLIAADEGDNLTDEECYAFSPPRPPIEQRLILRKARRASGRRCSAASLNSASEPTSRQAASAIIVGRVRSSDRATRCHKVYVYFPRNQFARRPIPFASPFSIGVQSTDSSCDCPVPDTG